jgi:hypothetical protein
MMDFLHIEAFAKIGNLQPKTAVDAGERYLHMRAAGVLGDVAQRFLRDPVQRCGHILRNTLRNLLPLPRDEHLFALAEFIAQCLESVGQP